MTQEQFQRGWMEVSKQYNSIGAVLDMLAVTSVYDAYDAVEPTPLFRHTVKRSMNLAVRAARRYEQVVKEAYREKYSLWVDYNMAMQSQLETKVFILYNSIHRFLSFRRTPHLAECSRCLLALVLACNAKDYHELFFARVEKETRIRKFRELYSYARMDGICLQLQAVTHTLLRQEDGIVDAFNNNEEISLALVAINRHLENEDNLNAAAKSACSMDIGQYGDALREIEEREEAKRAAERAEKAAADKVAEQMKTEAQKAKDEAVAARLSEKYNVKPKRKK